MKHKKNNKCELWQHQHADYHRALINSVIIKVTYCFCKQHADKSSDVYGSFWNFGNGDRLSMEPPIHNFKGIWQITVFYTILYSWRILLWTITYLYKPSITQFPKVLNSLYCFKKSILRTRFTSLSKTSYHKLITFSWRIFWNSENNDLSKHLLIFFWRDLNSVYCC